MRIVGSVQEERLRHALRQAATRLDADLIELGDEGGEELLEAVRAQPQIVVLEASPELDLERIRAEADRSGSALVLACHDREECEKAWTLGADEWVLIPTGEEELGLRLEGASHKTNGAIRPHDTAESVELLRYKELLIDKTTRLPTIPVVVEHVRELLSKSGQVTVLYLHFTRYVKLEEIYGWQRLDEILETTATAVREFYERENADAETLMLLPFRADDDFVLLTCIPTTAAKAERRIMSISQRLHRSVYTKIQEEHGKEMGELCWIYIGASTVFRDPKVRPERLLYRGMRAAAEAAHGAEEWERTRRVADLKSLLHEGAVYIEYHPIIDAATEEIYGYEALARGVEDELRSPEVLFEVAEEANLIWELSRLLRRRSVEGIRGHLKADHYLFLNVDPHDFDDPEFRNIEPEELGVEDAKQVVLEITERVAITDYPLFQEHLAAFRERGFRFAVDDAGSGYAGLGSIANLAPDYIKLDISLISQIDSNFLKQNLVETMVNFAETHGTKVIAEGVERREEFETVRELGVHLVQGFLFQKPARLDKAA